MSAPLWLPGVTRLPPTGQSTIPLGLQGRGKCLFTWHTFEAPYSYSPDGIAAMRYLHSQGSTSTFVLHPITGALVQGLPANVGARTLRANGPAQHTNAYGTVHMQVEVIAYARRPWTLDLTDAGRAALQRLMDFLRSHDIPDQWAWSDMTRPPATYAEANRPGTRGQPDRSGHATHSRWWANDHWDPGAIADPWVIAPPALIPGPPTPPATPGRDGDVFYEGADGDDVHAWQVNLAAAGYDVVGIGPFGPKTTAATRAFQTDHGLTVDGRVGLVTRTTMEDTMSKLDQILARLDQPTQLSRAERRAIAQEVVGYKNVDAAGNTDVFGFLVGAHRRALEAATHAAAAEAALTALAEQTGGVDVEAVRAAARAGAEDAISKLDFEVTAVTATPKED